MSYTFNGTSNYLQYPSPVSAAPLSISFIGRAATAGAFDCGISICDDSVANHGWYIHCGSNCSFDVRVGGGAVRASVGSVSNNEWHQYGGVAASSASRIAYLDGVGGTEQTTNATPLNVDVIRLAEFHSSGGFFWNDELQEVAVWNVALTAQEMASLGNGLSPVLVRPDSLVFYAPLLSHTNNMIGGAAPSASDNPTIAGHYRTHQPDSGIWVPPSVAAGSGFQPAWVMNSTLTQGNFAA